MAKRLCTSSCGPARCVSSSQRLAVPPIPAEGKPWGGCSHDHSDTSLGETRKRGFAPRRARPSQQSQDSDLSRSCCRTSLNSGFRQDPLFLPGFSSSFSQARRTLLHSPRLPEIAMRGIPSRSVDDNLRRSPACYSLPYVTLQSVAYDISADICGGQGSSVEPWDWLMSRVAFFGSDGLFWCLFPS